MADMFKPTLRDMINEVEREIALRKRLYPIWIETGKLTQRKADRQLQIMEAVAAELSRIAEVFGGQASGPMR